MLVIIQDGLRKVDIIRLVYIMYNINFECLDETFCHTLIYYNKYKYLFNLSN